MATRREVQIGQLLQELASRYFARESLPNSLMTITRAELASDLKNVTIYFSVIPQNKEAATLVLMKRARSDFREYVKEHSFFQPIPTIDFEVDIGEKNRQRVDELTRK